MPIPMAHSTVDTVFHVHGLATRRLDDTFEVETRLGVFRAIKAAGCLMEPEAGDKVLLTVDPLGECYILNILERSQDKAVELAAPGGLTITTPGGSFRVAAEQGLNLTSPRLEIEAVQGHARIREFQWTGRSLAASLSKADLVIKMLETSAEVVVQKARQSFRFIEELEQACLGRLRCLVEGSLFMKGKRASLTAEETIKIDGESIHLG
ncbi:MAG: DUF3540 domain-containing protein [Deltaproteobacteria bacterium]|nr:DUF3540 domain-containing protein [Deltaproteobacteria bacterium]